MSSASRLSPFSPKFISIPSQSSLNIPYCTLSSPRNKIMADHAAVDAPRGDDVALDIAAQDLTKNLRGYLESPIFKQDKDHCWAIATAGCIELCYNLKNPNNRKALSPQDLVNNLELSEGESISAIKKVAKWINKEKNGICTLQKVPYVGKKQANFKDRNQHNKTKARFEVNEVKQEDEVMVLKGLIDQNVPVVATMLLTTEFARLKGDSIYMGPKKPLSSNEKLLTHAVLIVGYAFDEHNRLYYIVRNSDGLEWGNQGYGRIMARKNIFLEYGYAEV